MRKKILSLCLLLMLFLWIPLLMSCDRQKGGGLWVYADRALLFSTENGPALRQARLSGRVRLTFYNNTDRDTSVTLYTDAGEEGFITLSAAPGETDAASMNLTAKTELNDGIRVSQDGADHAYILSTGGLETAVQTGAPDITLLQDISVDGPLSVTAPLSLSTDGHMLTVSEILSFTYAGPGALSLSGDISAAGFYARAPKCHITLPDVLVPENISFQVAAASLNKEKLDGSVTASSMEELQALSSGDAWERAASGMTIFLGDFAVDEQVTFTQPVSLTRTGAVLNAPIAIQTDESGNIRLKGAFAQDTLQLEAPECSLFWDDYGPPLHEAAQMYHVAFYNGQDPAAYVLGGNCNALPEISLKAADNTYLTEDIAWSTDGYDPFVLSARANCAVSPSCLKNARLSIQAPQGCTVAFSGENTNEDGTVNLLDPLGCYFTVSDETGSSLYYMKTDCDLQLPVVIIETEDGRPVASKEEYVGATVSIESDFTEGLPSLEPSGAEIRGRGNTTWEWSEKKPYKLKFDQSVSVLGMEHAKTWVLLANFADKSLIRNYVALECAKVLDNMDCYATQHPVDVFINGKYVGVYTLGEQVEAGSGRLQIREDAGNVDTGFLLELGVSRESGHPVFSSSILHYIGVLEPKNIDAQALTYIENYINVTDRSVQLTANYENYIDVPSLIDWFIMTELSYNSDSCFRRSVFMTKGAGEKLKMAQVWDFDLAFGNSVADLERYEEWACLATDNGYVHYNWMCQLMLDDAFVEQLRDRWNAVKDTLLQTALASLEKGYRMTAPSADNNFDVWDILYVQVGLQPPAVSLRTTYASQVEYLKEFIEKRWNWMDGEINTFRE